MLASTVPNLKTVVLSYANSHKYLGGSSVILKYEQFHIQEPGESSPVLCLCILQVSIGCKRLLQRKRWNPQAGQLLARWINTIKSPEVLCFVRLLQSGRLDNLCLQRQQFKVAKISFVNLTYTGIRDYSPDRDNKLT